MIDGIIIGSSSQSEARQFLELFHYDGFGRSAKVIYAAKAGEIVIGVAKFCSQGRQGTAGTIKLQQNEILELDRFCIHDQYHEKNLGSFLMSRYLKKIRKEHPTIKAIVSFADPAHGHDGTLYKASNWTELGETTKSYYYELPDGKIIKKRSFYNHIKKHRMNVSMSESEVAKAMGLTKVATPPKKKFVIFL
jgi:hypothetical protein